MGARWEPQRRKRITREANILDRTASACADVSRLQARFFITIGFGMSETVVVL